MRFTTKLSAYITLLVAVGMLLILLATTFSYFYLSQQRMESRLRLLVTTFDQTLLSQPPETIKSWLPVVMSAIGVVKMDVVNNNHTLFQLSQPANNNVRYTYGDYKVATLPLLQHPGVEVRLTYIDPLATFSRSLQSTSMISGAIGLTIIIVLLSFRWLRLLTNGMERLEKRANRILSGERDTVERGDVHEWPLAASSAIDLLLNDLSEAREQRSRVDTLIRVFAAQDGKTGLNNRIFFDNQLTTQIEEEGSHGVVMMIRLPDFDTLREIHGNQVSQELMHTMVNMLSTFVMRYPSALLARYFHSDFSVLLPHCTLKEADVIAAQLVKAVSALPIPHIIDRDALLYIGISTYRHGQTPEQVMDFAEQATRHASLQGSNSWYVYDNKVPEKGRGSVKWRTLLEQTLARGGPRLYQKPALTKEGKMHHREIMQRIYDGEQELQSAEFIPLVNQLGLSQSYDRQMVSRIIPLLAQWPQETLAFPIMVDSLLQRSFLRWIRDTMLQCKKQQRNRMLIELAEADLCQHIDRLRPALRLLSGLGCRLAVSQAGLTVVSTSYIKSLPVEIVKLHPGLVRSIDRRIENQLFVESLTGACEGSHAQVFAAGVRTRNEWQTLLDKGVRGGQGVYFASPEPVELSSKKYSHN